MNNKISLAFLMLIIAPLFSAFRGPVVHVSSSPAKILGFIPIAIGTDSTRTVATNLILQSKDGGQTWQDISQGLPASELPEGLAAESPDLSINLYPAEIEGFFAGESDLYLRANNVMYRSRSNLKTPVWEKEIVLDPRSASIAFNPSGVMAFNNGGQVYQKISGVWLPIYSNFKKQSVESIFETSDGTILVGCLNGLYKSVDKGQSWKQVQDEGWVMDIVESEGVLIGTGQRGIMRSTDNGEHWDWVISDGGVGIAVERIDGGFAAISYSTTIQARRIHISLDRGKTWKAIDEGLRPALSISSIKQVGKYLICGHPDGIFRSSDMGETWEIVYSIVDKKVVIIGNTMKTVDLGFGGGKKVFKIYVSGSTLYAVARGEGC